LPLKAIAKPKILAFFRRRKIRDLFDVFAMLQQQKIAVGDLERLYAVEIGKG